MTELYQKIYSAAYKEIYKQTWLAPQEAHKVARFLTSDFIRDFGSVPAIGYYCRHCVAVPIDPRGVGDRVSV